MSRRWQQMCADFSLLSDNSRHCCQSTLSPIKEYIRIVQCEMYTLQFASGYTVQLEVCSVQCAVYSVQCIVCSVQCAVEQVQSAIFTARTCSISKVYQYHHSSSTSFRYYSTRQSKTSHRQPITHVAGNTGWNIDITTQVAGIT